MAWPTDWAIDEQVTASDFNKVKNNALVPGALAGETISGATLPVACFYKASDNRWWACDGNDDTKVKFAGFAISTATAGNAISIQTVGRVSGFSGLTAGALYYVGDSQTLSTTKGTYEIPVGVAISATEILIYPLPPDCYIGSDTWSATPTDSTTTPANCNMVLITFAYSASATGEFEGVMILRRVGASAGNDKRWYGSTPHSVKLLVSWASNTISYSLTTSSSSPIANGVCYFYT